MNSFDILIKRQIKLTVLTVIAVILMTVTISYALYQTNYENTTNQVISIGSLGLTATGTPITLSGLYPMEEYDLTDSYPRYEFTLENKTDNVYNDYTLMYELVLTSTSQDFITSDYQYIMYKIDGMEAKPLSESWDADINGYKILDGRLLSHDESLLDTSLNGKDAENHSIVFWLSTTAPNSMNGKSVSLSMTLNAYAGRFNYLEYYASPTGWGDNQTINNNVFGKTISRELFENISIVNSKSIPTNAIDSWDVSQKQNGEIMAWYTDTDSDNLYELYIGQDGGVIANPNSSYLFHRYLKVKNIDVTYLNTSLVTNMRGMFSGSTNSSTTTNSMNVEEIIGLNNFDTSNVTDISYMFFVCAKLETVNLSSFDTSKVTDMARMFGGYWGYGRQYTGFTTLDLSNFDTSNVVNMGGAFAHCKNIKKLDLSNFDTSKVTTLYTNYGGIFSSMDNLEELNISNMTFNLVTNSAYYTETFYNVKSNITIITNECAESFVRARLADANKPNATVIIKPCIRVCYLKRELPSTYVELEYIESTGTQYIDTGYIPKMTTKLELDLSFNGTFKDTNTYGGGSALLGVTENNGQATYSINFGGSSSHSNRLYPWFNKSYQVNGQQSQELNITNAIRTNRNTLTVESGSIRYGTVSRSITPKSGNQTSSMLLFGRKNVTNNATSIFTAYNMRVYSLKLYENNILVRNYIPVMRNSDNAIGLYETINNVFYGNSGTGTFNAGDITNTSDISDYKNLIGDTMQIVDTINAKVGYTFIGWNTKLNGTGTMFKQGEEVDASVLKSIGDEITLYAIWEAN